MARSTKKSMPTEKRIDARRDFTRRILPWLITAVMLAVYVGTLNHWVSFLNLQIVTFTSGWFWEPQLIGPLYYLITLPIRLLPAPAIPFALNLFSAVCAALTLGLLARSVGLLPHDRTEAQQARERNDFFLLTIRSAWFPPFLAVLLCGLQLTFWEMATNGGNEMFDVLLFALVVWSLLEYRLDEREWRLYLSSVIVGAGMAEGGTMVGFFPLFIVAIIWVRGLRFFNLQFLGRMAVCGLAGVSFFLLLPVLAAISGKTYLTFFQLLKFSLMPQYQVLKLFFLAVTNPGQYLDDLIMPLFISLMPLLVLSIRWKFGDSSRIGSALANITFHSIHAIFLGVCAWLVFDPPFSPREKGFGLTLYYVIALSAGYYAGYFLLIFGKRHPRSEEFPPISVKLLNWTVVAGVWLLGILAVVGLVYKNKPLIQAANDNSLSRYASLIVKSLPSAGAIVISDDPRQLYLTQAALAHDGRMKDYLLIDSSSLGYPGYHRYLHKTSPQKWPLLVTPQQTNMLNPIGLLGMFAMLNRSNTLCYLQPSFGYYFEEFYLEPHGLVYQLKLLPNDTLLPPLPNKDLIRKNEEFWADAQTDVLASVENSLAADSQKQETFAESQLGRLHIPHEVNFNAAFVGLYCSRSLNFWGVELQKANMLTNAAACFQRALALNPDNVVAQINLGFNRKLQAGDHHSVDISQTSPDHLGKFDDLLQAIKEGGPFDEPAFCYEWGYTLVAPDNGYFRQAAAQFERVRQLDPGYLPDRIWLARIYALNHLPDRVLDVLAAPMNRSENFSPDEAGTTELDMLASAAYFQKNELPKGVHLLEKEVSRDPTNNALLTAVEQIYVTHGLFTNALAITDRKLSVSSNDPNWLFMRGYIYNQLKKYNEAIGAFNAVLAIRKDDPNALFERAGAYLSMSNYSAARADYEKEQTLQTNSYQAAFGLGETAWRQHDTNEAIRNFEVYLANAPTNIPQTKAVIERLHELKQSQGDK